MVLKTRVYYFWRRRKSRAGGDYAAAAAFFWPMTYQKVTAAAMTSRGMAPIFTQFQPKKWMNGRPLNQGDADAAFVSQKR